MGCSQAGCLKPKSKQRYVYIDLIQSIHRQAKLITEVTSIGSHSAQSTFDMIVSKINKKGLLKKLVDNLISHRDHIQDCIKQNQQICMSSSQSIQRITSLVIIDTVVNEIIKNKKIMNNCTEADQEINSLSLTNPIMTKTTIRQSTQFIFLQKKQVLIIQNQMDRYILHIIIFLLQQQKGLYDISISILSKYLKNKVQKLYEKTQVYQLFNILIQKIQQNPFDNASLVLFSQLLNKTKGSIREQETDQKYIHFFMKKYLKNYQINYIRNAKKQKKSLKKIQFLTANSKTQSDEQELIALQQNRYLITSLLQSFLNRYFKEHTIIYQSLLMIFDEYEFDLTKVSIIWKAIQQILKRLDYENHFIQGLLLNLLDYNMSHHSLDQRKSFYNLKQLKNQKYANISSRYSKLNGFKVIKYWIIQKNIDINEAISYIGSNILRCYVQNYVYFDNSALQASLNHEILEIFCLSNEKSFYVVINNILQAIKQYKNQNNKQEILVELLNQLIQKKKNYKKIYEETDFFENLSQYFHKQIILKVLAVIKKVFQNLEPFNKENQQKTMKISNQMFKLYHLTLQHKQEEQKIHQDPQSFLNIQSKLNINKKMMIQKTILYKHDLVHSILEIIKLLHNKGYSTVIYSCLRCINQDLQIQNHDQFDQQACISLYFIEELIMSMIFLLNKNQKVPQQIVKNQMIIERHKKNHNFNINFIDSLKSIISVYKKDKVIQNENDNQSQISLEQLDLKHLFEMNNQKIEATQQFLMIKPEQYNEIINNLRTTFGLGLGSITKKQGFFSSVKQKSLRRSDSVCSDESNLETASAKQNLDQSFHQIVDKIRLG